MIQERRLEFNIQLGVFTACVLVLVGSFVTDDIAIGFIGFYFVVGISQLISLILKFFSMEKFGVFLKIYAWLIIPVWVILLIVGLVTVFDIDTRFIRHDVLDTVGSAAVGYLIFSAFASPVLAMGFLLHLYSMLQKNKTEF